MDTYVLLLKWTDDGRRSAGSLAERVDDLTDRLEADLGIKVVGAYLTLGRYDQVVVVETPDDDALVKVLMLVAERGFAETETLRAYTMEELGELSEPS